MSKLTQKQKTFAEYYIKTLNASEAAVKSGYSPNTAGVIGHENLNKPKIKNYIDERLKQLESERIASAEEVLQYLTRIVRGEDSEEVVAIEGIGDGCSKAITVKKAVGARERIKAAELLGKRYMLFTEKQQIDIALPTIISGENDLE